MTKRFLLPAIISLSLFAAGYLAGTRQIAVHAAASSQVFELRIYHTYEGKLDDLLKRFRDRTITIFLRHGIKNVAYWTPTDEPLKGKTLVYVISHASRRAATENWKAFQDDPEWQKVKAASEANGKIVEKVDSTFLEPTDFSPLK